MDTLTILGAGRTGRGFLARLFHEQAAITFIDRDPALVAALSAAGAYRISYFGSEKEERVEKFRAFHTEDPACEDVLKASDAVFVSVKASNTQEAGAWLSRFSHSECVVACENATRPAALFGSPLSETALSGAVFCTTVEDGNLNILSEEYPVLHVSAGGASEAIEGLRGIAVENDFDTLMHRKIYTYNGASGLIAYLGAEKGIEEYAEAAADPDIAGALDRFYREVNKAICAEYGIEPAEQRAFAAFSRAKFENRAIVDSVSRNAADPARKLSPEERIIAPARLIAKHGGDAAPLVRTAVAALRYMGVHGELEAADVLKNICGLKENESLYEMVSSMIRTP